MVHHFNRSFSASLCLSILLAQPLFVAGGPMVTPVQRRWGHTRQDTLAKPISRGTPSAAVAPIWERFEA
jgi:hypothetical protein